jgi:ABC-type branched-subunit amino acid transport system substrate-binding protein
MKLGKGSRSAVVVAAVVVAAASGCSTKAPESSGSAEGEAGDVTTDIGVEGETITLGVLTDLTGVFAALGKDITQANELFWEENQVCDTYDVEIANGYDYLFQEGLLQEGATVGHIYFEGEYGANGLAGSQAVAEERGLQLIESQIKSTDQDMSAQVTQFAAAGVDLIALTVAPGQLASVASVMEAQGLDVPILGSNPVFAPGLLDGPSAEWLKSHLYVASPVSAFADNQDLLDKYTEAYPDANPSLGVPVGWGMSTLMKQVLDTACENGDLTRQGVLDAFSGLEEVDTGGLVVPIRGFETGKSPSLSSFILQPADVPGGASVLAEAFEGEFAEQIAG